MQNSQKPPVGPKLLANSADDNNDEVEDVTRTGATMTAPYGRLSNDAPRPVRTNAPDESSNNNSNSTIQRTALYKQFTSYLARPNVVASGGGSSIGQKRTLSSYAVHDDPRQTKDEWQIPTLEEFEFFEKVGRFVSLESRLTKEFCISPFIYFEGSRVSIKETKAPLYN
jgi:hypothetical protein